jgi:uncharacterized protein YjdB
MKKVNLLLFVLLFVDNIHAQSGDIGSVHWTISGNALIISGSGDIPNYENSGENVAPWDTWRTAITDVRIETGVTAIGAYAFSHFSKLKAVDIPETVITIGINSFLFCESLTSIAIPASTTDIHDLFAQLCYALTDIVVHPSNKNYSSDNGVLFNKDMKRLVVYPIGKTGKYVIPDTVQIIGENAFFYAKISSVTIPASVTSISIDAFYSCSLLTEIVNQKPAPQIISAYSFRNINFSNCVLMVPASSINAYKTVAEWSVFTNIVAFDAGLTFGDEEIFLLPNETKTLPVTFTGELTNPNLAVWDSSNPAAATVDGAGTVTAINPGISTITASIGSMEARCTVIVFEVGGDIDPLRWGIINNLLIISGKGDMPDFSTPSYSGHAPWYQWGTYSGNLTGTSGIGRIEIREGVTGIGSNAFYGCHGIYSVYIPASVTIIGFSAFEYCAKMETVHIPASVKNIVTQVFLRCSAMTSITVDADNTAYCSEDGVLFTKDKRELISFPCGKAGHYNIPPPVVITAGAFMYCEKLTSVSIPSSMNTIGNSAFYYCTALTSINIPESISIIGAMSFYCSGLKTVTIPASVTTIAGNAFSYCRDLTKIVNYRPTPQVISAGIFVDVNFNECVLRVPAASIGLYGNAPEWKQFANILPLETELTDVEITLDKNELYLLPGGTATLAATVTGDAPNLNVEWNCGDAINRVSTIATVSNNGTVTALKAGTSVITASSGSNEAACTVTVIEPGKSTIEGTAGNTGTEDLRVKLFVK